MNRFSIRPRLIVFGLMGFIRLSYCTYSIQDQTPEDCFQLTTNGYSQYFDVTRLSCAPCAEPNTNQKTSDDGMRCVCQDSFYLTRDDGGDISCSPCPAGMVSSASGWECISCETSNTLAGSKCSSCNIQKKEITVERQLNGSWGSPPQRLCQTCAAYTHPDEAGKQCVRCSQLLSVIDSPQCDCPVDRQAGGLCFKASGDIVSSIQQLFKVTFGSLIFDSQYFKKNAQAAEAMCKYGNRTACQLLANLCTLILYDRGQEGAPNTCFLYNQLASKSAFSLYVSNWPANLPWLYYTDKANLILTDFGISTHFTFPDTILSLQASTYTLDGQFLGYQSVLGGLLQLCKNSENYMNAAYTFGTNYYQECQVPVRNFWDTEKYPMQLIELWLKYQKDGTDQLYAIPVLIDNYADSNGKFINTDETDKDLWQFTRRFFLIDNISGKQVSTTGLISSASGLAQDLRAVRYTKDIKIHIKLQPKQMDGLIIPPYIEINYDTASYDDYLAKVNATVSFQVVYSMDLTKHERDMAIAVGVLSAFAIVISMFHTWGWSRRTGKIAIDFATLIKFFFFACGNLSNAFFVTTFGAAIWWLIFYKRQNTVNLLVPEKENAQFIAFVVTAFVLKLIQLIHIIICQTMTNVFFIDWERLPSPAKLQKNKDSASIWRTYLVANEWNEVQTKRKISVKIQHFVAILLLYAVGFGNIATMDPRSDLVLTEDNLYHAPTSRLLRIGIIGIIYILLAFCQWIVFSFIYERYFEDPVRQFVDLCSASNISVFILDNYLFGYYIHGRSVHGQADVSLREMHIYFVKEENDLCSKRGLGMDSDQQTFEIAIPRKLRSAYDKTIMPILTQQTSGSKTNKASSVAGSLAVSLDPRQEQSLKAYAELNYLLQKFIDHCYQDAGYIIKTKTLVESITGVEFQDPVDSGFFYPDNGHSFDAVLMYGHELTWIIFEVLLYAVTDLAFQNYFVDGFVTCLVMAVVGGIRNSFGRKNLANKTLVDKRFLI